MGVPGMQGVGEQSSLASEDELAELALSMETGLTVAELRRCLNRALSPLGLPVAPAPEDLRELSRAAQVLRLRVARFNRTIAAELQVELNPYLACCSETESLAES